MMKKQCLLCVSRLYATCFYGLRLVGNLVNWLVVWCLCYMSAHFLMKIEFRIVEYLRSYFILMRTTYLESVFIFSVNESSAT